MLIHEMYLKKCIHDNIGEWRISQSSIQKINK